jgi:group I intron endonuclease
MPEIYEGNTGVYCIRNVKNGKRYVGSTAIDFMKRWRQHQKYLRANRHCNVYLQRAWNKYGSGAFIFQILERCEPVRCTDRETLWIAHLNTANQGKGYNICKTGRNPLGVKRSDETRAKHRKNWEDPEVRRKASIRMRLIAADPDVHRRVMDAKARITADPEYRRKMSESLKLHWADPERKRKHVESLRRQSASPEWRKHVKEAGARRRGIKFSEEHKRKMKEGQYRYLARKKSNLDGEQT